MSDAGSEFGLIDEHLSDEDDPYALTTKTPQNTPKRAAKLARFFGLAASEQNITRIRNEIESNKAATFDLGCMGENVVRIHMSITGFESYKTLLISYQTTAEEAIRLVLGKLGIEADPKNYLLVETSPDKQTKRALPFDECPLQTMSKWGENKTFHLKKNPDAVIVDEDSVYFPSLPFPSLPFGLL